MLTGATGKGDDLMRNYKLRKRIAKAVFLFSSFCFLTSILGCEAFARKFTRKPKKVEVEKPVLMPEDYSLSDIPSEQRYRQSFVFWQSWQEELVTALTSKASHKKRMTCIEEAIKNLEEMKPLLFEEKQKELDVYLGRLRSLKKDIAKDIYGANVAIHRIKAESLKRNIFRDFSYLKIKNHLR
jgi:hypothetical protein